MKYLKPEYSCTEDSWHILSSEQRESRKALWEQQCELYHEEFKRSQNHFSKRIISIETSDALHDCLLSSFCIVRGKKRDTFDIEAVFINKYTGKSVTVIYRDVKRCTSSLDFDQYVEFGDYLFGEFLYDNKNGLFSHNFVLIYDSEINIICKRMIVR